MSATVTRSAKARSFSAKVLPWALGVLGTIFAGWLVNVSPSFKNCIHTEKNEKTYQTLREDPTVVQGAPIRLELHAVCVEGWTEKYEGAVSAVATVFIAIFTLTLWGATKRLWQSAENQLREFQTSLGIANEHAGHMAASVRQSARAADAMERAATAMDESAWQTKMVASATGRTAGIMKENAERQLRAYVAMETAVFEIEDGIVSGYINVEIKNYGLTPAADLIVTAEYDSGPPRNEAIIFPISDSATRYPKAHIPPGKLVTLHVQVLAAQIDIRMWNALARDGQRAYLWGKIDYIDAFKEPRFTRFQMVNHFGRVSSMSWCEVGNDAT